MQPSPGQPRPLPRSATTSDHPSVTEAPIRAAADPTLDRFDRDIVEFLLRWNPYGGPPDDEVMPQFGMSREDLSVRAVDVILAGLAGALTDDERHLLRRGAAVFGITVYRITGYGDRTPLSALPGLPGATPHRPTGELPAPRTPPRKGASHTDGWRDNLPRPRRGQQ